jgi:hypothetical protein
MKRTSSIIYDSDKITPSNLPLQISAFKDISAFIFHEAQQRYNLNANIHYVQNDNEAHNDLMNKTAEIVFMSYDDTLSIALQDKCSDIAAVIPVHFGILDLCGSINLPTQNIIGIDTDSGYARALRYYLTQTYTTSEYAEFIFTKAGATNLRYTALSNGALNATLLSPPFSYEPGTAVMERMYNTIGLYQGIVANINKSWLTNLDNQSRLNNFVEIFTQTIQFIANYPNETVSDLQNFYNLSLATATNVYNRLLQPDGLSMKPTFNLAALTKAEFLFNWSTGIAIPTNRTWIV